MRIMAFAVGLSIAFAGFSAAAGIGLTQEMRGADGGLAMDQATESAPEALVAQAPEDISDGDSAQAPKEMPAGDALQTPGQPVNADDIQPDRSQDMPPFEGADVMTSYDAQAAEHDQADGEVEGGDARPTGGSEASPADASIPPEAPASPDVSEPEDPGSAGELSLDAAGDAEGALGGGVCEDVEQAQDVADPCASDDAGQPIFPELPDAAPASPETDEAAAEADATLQADKASGNWNTLKWALSLDNVLTFSGNSSTEEIGFMVAPPWDEWRHQIRKVVFAGPITMPQDLTGMFYNYTALTAVVADSSATFDLSHTTNLSSMFEGCTSLTSIDGLASWDVSQVTCMYSMFFECASLKSLTALSSWDVSSVQDMIWMFGRCTSLADIKALSSWNTLSLTDMSCAFCGCESLTSAEPLASWHTASVVGMGSLFNSCASLTSIKGLSSWNVSSVTDMTNMFDGCTTLEYADFSGWNNAAVIDMIEFLDDAVALSQVKLGSGFRFVGEDSYLPSNEIAGHAGWQSAADGKWYTAAQIATQRKGIADTYTKAPLGTGVTMYRLYNKWSGEHLYTASPKERGDLVHVGWNDEGVGWIAPKASKTPVYRVYNPYSGDHHYTTSDKERDDLVAIGWKDEGIGWYSDDAKGTPLYRQFNPYETIGTHNYTTSKKENDDLKKIGWKTEGIAWYGLKQ